MCLYCIIFLHFIDVFVFSYCSVSFYVAFQQYFSYIVSVSLQPTCRKSLTNFIAKYFIDYTLIWTGFELTTLLVIATDCTGSCKSNYHTTMTRTAPIVVGYSSVCSVYHLLSLPVVVLHCFCSLCINTV